MTGPMEANQEFTSSEVEKLAEVFPPARRARALLREAGYPMAGLPGEPDTAVAFWEQISESLSQGTFPHGRRLIMAAASRRFPAQPVFAADADSHAPEALRVMVVGASPSATGRIRPDRDAKAIEAVANRQLLVRYCPAAEAADLRQALDFRPDILHLACHGRATNLVFEDLIGGAHVVRAHDIVETLRLYRELGRVRLRGVVLGSCEGDQIAAGFTDVAERVVAHRGPFDDQCAVTFAGYLYEALSRTHDLDAAARLAAQHTVLSDQACSDVVAGLLVLQGEPA